MRLSTLAVHPYVRERVYFFLRNVADKCSAYWRRGHASRLVRWCTYLADLDGVPVVRLDSVVHALEGPQNLETIGHICRSNGSQHRRKSWI